MIMFNNNSGAIVALDYCKAFDSANKKRPASYNEFIWF